MLSVFMLIVVMPIFVLMSTVTLTVVIILSLVYAECCYVMNVVGFCDFSP